MGAANECEFVLCLRVHARPGIAKPKFVPTVLGLEKLTVLWS